MSIEIEEKLSIGLRMGEERKRLGKSRAELANACGKTPQAIGEFERGVSYPGGAVLAGYARAGADVLYILAGRHGLQAVAALDTAVLSGVIEAVETRLKARTLSAQKKAELIVVAYEYAVSTGQCEPTALERFIRLAS